MDGILNKSGMIQDNRCANITCILSELEGSMMKSVLHHVSVIWRLALIPMYQITVECTYIDDKKDRTNLYDHLAPVLTSESF